MKKLINKFKFFLTVASVAGSVPALAQYDPLFTQYMFNETFINPAYAGSREAMSTTLVHRQQWVSFPGRPVTTSFNLHGPLQNNKMGLGISVLSEKIGASRRSLIYGNYAYRVQVQEKGTLAMGLMAGMDSQSNRFSDLELSNDVNAPDDPQFLQNNNRLVAPNFGVGLYYNTDQFYAGLSIPRLVDNQMKLSGTNGTTIRSTRLAADKFTYHLAGGYLFNINEQFRLRTNCMIKAVQNSPLQLDLGANLLIKETFWTGLSFRTKSAVSVLLGMQVNKQLLVCYSYDYGINQIQRYSNGSHEIALNYLFSFTGRRIITPRYF